MEHNENKGMTIGDLFKWMYDDWLKNEAPELEETFDRIKENVLKEYKKQNKDEITNAQKSQGVAKTNVRQKTAAKSLSNRPPQLRKEMAMAKKTAAKQKGKAELARKRAPFIGR